MNKLPFYKKIIISTVEKLGYDLVKRDPLGMLDVFERNRGKFAKFENIRCLIDVGIGTSGTVHLWSSFPAAKLLLIDPLVESKKGVAKVSIRDPIFFQVAVGSDTGRRAINIPDSPNQSSFYNRTMLTAKPTREVREVEVRRLDDVVLDSGLVGPFGLKIDTEGGELEVLRGGRETLKQCEFVAMEVRHSKSSFFGGYSLRSLMSEMHDAGFVPSEILDGGETMSDILFERVCERWEPTK